jgi:hypothetical protein
MKFRRDGVSETYVKKRHYIYLSLDKMTVNFANTPWQLSGTIEVGTGMKSNQMRCYQCRQPGHYSKNFLEKRQNNMGRQSKLFVGLIKHSVNMLSHTGPHNLGYSNWIVAHHQKQPWMKKIKNR